MVAKAAIQELLWDVEPSYTLLYYIPNSNQIAGQARNNLDPPKQLTISWTKND